MKTIKVLLIAVVAACTFADAGAQIKLPPPPPAPPNPLHLKRPGAPVVRSRRAVRSRRHSRVRIVAPPRPALPR